MGNFSRSIARTFARTFCRMHGSARNYRAYYRRAEKILFLPEKGRGISSNGFGTSLWLLGAYSSEWPRIIEASPTESYFSQYYTLCEEERGCLVAFLNPDADFSDTSPFEHSGVYFSSEDGVRLMLHQPDIRRDFELTSLKDYMKLEENKHLEPEFYCPVERR